MHRRTIVIHSSSPLARSAKLPRPVPGKRLQTFARATTPARTGRYSLELLRGVVPNLQVVPETNESCFGSPRIRNIQSDRCEQHAVRLRKWKRGIAPDVVRRETGTPQRNDGQQGRRSERQFGSETARVCFLRHFTLAQPYF